MPGDMSNMNFDIKGPIQGMPAPAAPGSNFAISSGAGPGQPLPNNPAAWGTGQNNGNNYYANTMATNQGFNGMFSGDPAMQQIMGAMPGFNSIRNPDGTLMNQFKVGQAVDPNQALSYYGQEQGALGKLSGMANSGDMTDIGKMQDARMSGAALNSATDANRSAYDQMALHGGVSSGAGERMATAGQVNAAQAVSGAHNQAMMGDAAFKQNLLTQLPSMYGQLGGQQANTYLSASAQNAGNDRFNVSNSIGDVGGYNNALYNGWNTGASVYGDGQVSQAQAAAANRKDPGLFGQGGFLGTGIGG